MGKTALNFSECSLELLDDMFALDEIFESSALDAWLNQSMEISGFEKKTLEGLRKQLNINVKHWNEFELSYHFIAPIFATIDFSSSKQYSLFVERAFGGMVGDVEMRGKPDGMIASGFRKPKQPFFCFHEYKKSFEQKGDPAGQCLAAMLVAQEMNEHQHAIYGCYVVGADWYFMLLQGREYVMSTAYVATRDDIFDIFRILKVLKQIIIGMLP